MHPAIRTAAIFAAGACTPMILSQAAQQTQRFPQFDNDTVKVWRTVILPHQPLAPHHHDHPRVIIALTGGNINVVDASGKTEPHVWETGKAYWLPANAPNTMHSDINSGDKPIDVMVVELQKEH
jgi:beta-alanine degradation protein BauB